MELILIMIGIPCLIWTINSQLGWVKQYIKNKKDTEINLYCLKCYSFWITLIITLNPLYAAIAAYIGYMIDKNETIKL